MSRNIKLKVIFTNKCELETQKNTNDSAMISQKYKKQLRLHKINRFIHLQSKIFSLFAVNISKHKIRKEI